MPLTDLIIPTITILFGFIVAYLFLRARVNVFEERARNDLER